jgi:4'-phosphopantetheinyl transferase
MLIASAGDASMWLVDLDGPAESDAAQPVLSADERARAARFVFDVHRQRFVACRVALRRVLGRQLGVAPAAIAFEYGPSGKPALAGRAGPRFNVSHSDRYALIAVAAAEVGVDLERIRPLKDMDQLAARVFSDGERRALATVPAGARAEAFFAGWTRKEAYIKARGDGIGLLGAIEVSLTPDEPARLIRVADQPDEPSRWALQAISPVPGFAAAVCVLGSGYDWRPV